MQVWTPSAYRRRDGEFAVELNPGEKSKSPFAVINLSEDGGAALVIQSVADADRLIKAAVEAKRLLLGDDEPAPDHAFVRPGQVSPEYPPPDNCVACGQPEAAHAVQTVTTGVVTSLDESLAAAEADPANPYGSSKHGRFDAGSAAEVAEGVDVPTFEPDEERQCDDLHHLGFICTRTRGHGFQHAAIFSSGDLAYTWPQGPAIVPFPHLPHLPQHTGGNPMCSLCGLDHYALHAIETTGGAR